MSLPTDSLPVRLLVSFTMSEQIKCERLLSAFICVEAVVRRAEPVVSVNVDIVVILMCW